MLKHNIINHSFLKKSIDKAGYPDMEFETFYQRGLECFRWNLPRLYTKQAFSHLCSQWESKEKKRVETWQIRAFIYGTCGFYQDGLQKRQAPENYKWPIAPDASWDLIICVYDNFQCEIDFVHPVSRQFLSEDQGAFELPSDNILIMGHDWFSKMGFEVMRMYSMMEVEVSNDNKNRHLSLINNQSG